MILRNRRQRIDTLIHDALSDAELSGYPLSKATGLRAGTIYLHLARLRDEGEVDGRRDANGRVFYRWIGDRAAMSTDGDGRSASREDER